MMRWGQKTMIKDNDFKKFWWNESEFSFSGGGLSAIQANKTQKTSTPIFVTAKGLEGYYPVFTQIVDIFSEMRDCEISNHALEKQVHDFVQVFAESLTILNCWNSILPSMRIEAEEDNVFFEWIINRDFKIGFTIVEESGASSWFLFKKDKTLTGSVSGELSVRNRYNIIRWLLLKAMENM